MNTLTHRALTLTLALAGTIALFALGGCDVVEPDMGDLESIETEKQATTDPQLQPNMGTPTIFSGLRHHPMGNALTYANCQDALVIASIGSSGQDGVCIDLDAAQGATNEFRTLSPLDTGLRWSAQGIVDGADFLAWVELKLHDGEIILKFDGTQSPATGMQLDLLKNGQSFEDYSWMWEEAVMTLQGSPVLTGTSVSTAFAGESAGGSGIRMTLHFESPVTVECPSSATIEVDEIRATWNFPTYDLDWMQEYLFTGTPGSTVTDIEMTSSRIAHEGLTYAGTCDNLIGVRRAGGWLGTIGDLARVRIDGFWDDTDVLRLRGVALNAPGQSFAVEIDGVAAGHKMSEPQSLVINLSLGWHANGLRVAGDYPSGDGYRMTVIRKGQVVADITRLNGQPSWALPSTPFAGFVVEAFDFDPLSFEYDAVGRAVTASGHSEAVRIHIEPMGLVSPPVPSTLHLEYDRLAPGAWFLEPRGDRPSPPLPDPTES